ncbi:MAG: hypothetical protein Q9162_000222 [Coniocarpon cinnabarinum]
MSGSPNPATAGRLETGANSSEAQKTPNRLSVWNASPSPVGSDRVLYEERDRRPKSKSNASTLVMLASLIVDPAIQLVFEFPERLSLKADAQPGIQTSSYYVTNSTGYNGPGMGRNPNVGQAQNVDPTMQAAIVGGFSTNTSYNLECPNEQCEWDSYTSPAYGEPEVPATEVNLAVFAAVKQATSQNWTYPPSQQMFCGIKMCAKTYEHAVFRNGTKIFSPPVETMLNFSVTNTSLNQEGTMHFIPSNADHPLGNDTDFSMNMNDFANLATYLPQLFGVSWSQGTDTGGQYFRNNDPDVTGTSFDDATPMVAEYLANHPDTDALMRNIGEAM